MRIANRLLALVVWLAVSSAAGLTLVEVTLALLGRPGWLVDRPAWAQTVRQLRWDDPAMIAAESTALVAGLLLVIAQLKPRRPALLGTKGGSPGRQVRFDRKGVELFLSRLAVADPDVAAAQVRIGRFRSRLTATLEPRTAVRSARRRLRQQLRAAGLELALRRRLRFKIKVKGPKRRTR